MGIADLRTAVLAVEHGLTVLHDDADVEIVGEVIDLDRRWVAPRGTI